MCAAIVLCTLQKELAEKIRAEYAMYAEDGSLQQGPASATDAVIPTGQKQQQQRPVELQVACMSRAGREPGYKKTNQDNCFAFEKYISEEQSMFGAMDGHGPHGKHLHQCCCCSGAVAAHASSPMHCRHPQPFMACCV